MRVLLVPAAIIAMLASLLLPLPLWLIDLLLVGNLVLAMMLLVSTLFIVDPLRLSSLPSILLLATLYRLALNISTTRTILSSGQGGAVIQAFGSVVVNGNFLVGVVIFLVITLIQFIVIAKGGERVAEVCARFTLDALPGKQMSIDADVRAGLIDFAEARRKRQELQTESRFYGALDGAMKFIKGDAIAGVVITAINILGGFAIGAFIDGLSLTEAFKHYSLLSIGDGLLSQIPAVLNAVAAGMVVTRVVRDEGVTLAEELLAQLLQEQKVRLLVGGLAGAAALLPGMPSLPFASLAAVLLIGAIVEQRGAAAQADADGQGAAPPPFRPKSPPMLQVQVNPAIAAELFRSGFAGQMQRFQQSVFQRFGLVLPMPEAIVDADPAGWRILVRGVAACDGKASINGRTCDEIREALLQVAADRRDELVDDILTRRLLEQLESEAPEMTSAVVPGIVSLTQLTVVLRELLREGIPVRNFDVILQAVAEYGRKAENERVLLEEVRIALRRVISQQVAPAGRLAAFLLDPMIDLALAKAERSGGSFDLEQIGTAALQLAGAPAGAALLTSRAARRIVKECLAIRGVRLPVLAHEELAAEVSVTPLGYVGAPVPELGTEAYAGAAM